MILLMAAVGHSIMRNHLSYPEKLELVEVSSPSPDVGISKVSKFCFLGITMLLTIEGTDYLCSSDSAGFRIVFHRQNESPFPNVNGFYIAPGTSARFALRKVSCPIRLVLGEECPLFSYSTWSLSCHRHTVTA